MIEINYYKTSDSGRHLRRQLLQVAAGWTLSNAEVVGVGPESLRGYAGGWHWGDTVYPTRSEAESNLRQNRWHLEGEAQVSEVSRNRSRASKRAAGLVSVEVALTPAQRTAIDAEADRLGLSRAATVAKWADSLAKKHERNNRQGGVK
jgi:hypothetical protein